MPESIAWEGTPAAQATQGNIQASQGYVPATEEDYLVSLITTPTVSSPAEPVRAKVAVPNYYPLLATVLGFVATLAIAVGDVAGLVVGVLLLGSMVALGVWQTRDFNPENGIPLMLAPILCAIAVVVGGAWLAAILAGLALVMVGLWTARKAMW